MNSSIVYTLGEMCACIPQLPSSYKVKKVMEQEGKVGHGHGEYSGAIGTKSSLWHGDRW